MSESDRLRTGAPGYDVEGQFEDFYRAAREEVVRALVLGVGSRELGREAADEAFTRAFERWDEVGSYDNPKGWVYRVALNWAKSRLRRRPPEPHRLLDSPAHYDELPEPELFAAIEALPLSYRAVVVSRFFFDWSIEDTALALDLPAGTVKTRQGRALRRLKKSLGVWS